MEAMSDANGKNPENLDDLIKQVQGNELLGPGSESPRVKALKELLIINGGYAAVLADKKGEENVIGAGTEKAVMAFEKNNPSLLSNDGTADGIVGPKFIAALEAATKKFESSHSPQEIQAAFGQADAAMQKRYHAAPATRKANLVHDPFTETLPGVTLELSILDKAQIIKESKGDTNAVSDSGALGYLQLEPETAKEQAKKMAKEITKMLTQGESDTAIAHELHTTPAVITKLLQPFDVKNLTRDGDYNITLGRFYRNHLVDIYRGNTELALVAYNAGPVFAKEWMGANEKSILDGTESMAAFIASLPNTKKGNQARNYATDIMANVAEFETDNTNVAPIPPEVKESAPPANPPKAEAQQTRWTLYAQATGGETERGAPEGVIILESPDGSQKLSYNFDSGPWHKGALPGLLNEDHIAHPDNKAGHPVTVYKLGKIAPEKQTEYCTTDGSVGFFVPITDHDVVGRSGFGIHPNRDLMDKNGNKTYCLNGVCVKRIFANGIIAL